MSEDFIKRAIDKAVAHNLGYVSVKKLQYKLSHFGSIKWL